MAARVTLGQIADRLRAEGLLKGERGLADRAAARPVPEAWTDSRRVKSGHLFCAVKGTETDGHRFLAEVSGKGAAGATVERRDHLISLPQIEVTDGRLAAAYAAACVYGDPWNELTVVGITGTNGKTTSTAILRHLLGRRAPAGSIGTLGALDHEGKVIPGTEGLTTPGPTEVARWLRMYRDGLGGKPALDIAPVKVEAVAMETSSHALAQDRLAAVRFDAALFTNLTRDHLDYHQTMDEYRAAKLRLLELLKPAGAVVLNADDPAWNGVGASDRRIVRFSTSAPADVRARDIRVGPGGMEFVLSTPSGDTDVAIPLFGDFNVSNALGCAAVLYALGWSVGEITAGLATLPQVPGRLERVSGPPASATVLIDYAHTPDALERAIAAIRPLVKGKLWVVFGAGGDRDQGKRPEMGRVAAERADMSIVTSDNPRTENPEAILDAIESGMGRAPRLRVPDRREAIRHALLNAAQDDVILLAGKGHETYQIVGKQARPFDERQVVREVLSERDEGSGGAG